MIRYVDFWPRDHPFKTSAKLHNFRPLPPSVGSFFTTIHQQFWPIFDPSPLKKCWRLQWMVSKNIIDFDPPLKKFNNRTDVTLCIGRMGLFLEVASPSAWPPIYLNWIFQILQLEISSLMNWYFFPVWTRFLLPV